ncbi:MAG: aminotransferase class III-fold pyridoxal phosphate-dependent enzyme, partial [Verrucomicrobiia bacterium]
FDEIYTGFWRTGHLFACDAEEVRPDLICLGKALTGGFPLSACVAPARLMDAWPKSEGEALHTSTFLGNPLGCAAAVASLRRWLDPALPQHLHAASHLWATTLHSTFTNHPNVRDLRGRGLMWGLELATSTGDPLPVGPVIEQALASGLILLGGGCLGNVISLAPSLAVTPDSARWAAARLAQLIRESSADLPVP